MKSNKKASIFSNGLIWFEAAVTIICIAGAVVFPMENISSFLYLTGSVFAPMMAIQIAGCLIVNVVFQKLPSKKTSAA